MSTPHNASTNRRRRLPCAAAVIATIATTTPVAADAPIAPRPTNPVRAGALAGAERWNYDRAAHLLRRAGFGGHHDDVQYLLALGLDGAVDFLVDYENVPRTDPDFIISQPPDRRAMRRIHKHASEQDKQAIRKRLRALHNRQYADLLAWWIRRMTVTPRPFEEKMTLFWHGHFTTGVQEVKDSRFIARQNAMLRRLAVAPFGDLLKAVCHDPAMLIYLDNAKSNKAHPNENFARELLELYTIGEGNYTEHDIKEAARALTGFAVGPDGFRFRRGQHDDGDKTFLGHTGRLDGDDIVDIILAQPATARYLADKLLVFFVRDDPPPELVNAVADKLNRTNYDIRETMRAIFKSKAFYATGARFTHIKAPIELVVSTVRTLRPDAADYWGMTRVAASMGQQLYQPPNVKGWDGGKTWITASTLFSRYAFARAVVRGEPAKAFQRRVARLDGIRRTVDELVDLAQHDDTYPGMTIAPQHVPLTRQMPLDPRGMLGTKQHWNAHTLVDACVHLLLQRPITPQQRATLIDIIGHPNDTVDLNVARDLRRVRTLLYAIMLMPEYQLA
ncbi:MAG: DUF1800 family protein [Phycisphaerae bacterium]